VNNIKTKFSIKDLENLSGVKAHTIRIWEKRHKLLEPNRTSTNIRTYSIESLQKLLNIAYLNNNGIKISKIAELEEAAILNKVKDIASNEKNELHAINSLKFSMLNFDQELFNNIYNNLLKEKSFSEVFYAIFLPLLNEIGLLWQTNTIMPAHEHFISILIKQKILLNIENISHSKNDTRDKTFVLFLPENEIHDIGLLFINYKLRKKGHRTIYLGASVPVDNLNNLQTLFNDITFISYFTVKPEAKDITNYLTNFSKKITINKQARLLILGFKTNSLNKEKLPENIYKFKSIEDILMSI
jgi:DNA-binding transcriptional MerR regulator